MKENPIKTTFYALKTNYKFPNSRSLVDHFLDFHAKLIPLIYNDDDITEMT